MHTLKNHLPMLSVHIQNAFVSQQSGALAINHGVHELSKSRPMKRAVRAEHETLDIVVIMAMTCVVRLSITCRFKWQVQFAIEVEPSYVEYIPQRDLGGFNLDCALDPPMSNTSLSATSPNGAMDCGARGFIRRRRSERQSISDCVTRSALLMKIWSAKPTCRRASRRVSS